MQEDLHPSAREVELILIMETRVCQSPDHTRSLSPSNQLQAAELSVLRENRREWHSIHRPLKAHVTASTRHVQYLPRASGIATLIEFTPEESSSFNHDPVPASLRYPAVLKMLEKFSIARLSVISNNRTR